MAWLEDGVEALLDRLWLIELVLALLVLGASAGATWHLLDGATPWSPRPEPTSREVLPVASPVSGPVPERSRTSRRSAVLQDVLGAALLIGDRDEIEEALGKLLIACPGAAGTPFAAEAIRRLRDRETTAGRKRP